MADSHNSGFLTSRPPRHSAFGRTEGPEVGFEYRWVPVTSTAYVHQAAQLIALRPDLILANSTIVARVLKQEIPAIPVVFVQVADPVTCRSTCSAAAICWSPSCGAPTR